MDAQPSFVQRRLFGPIRAQLLQGTTPQTLALSCAIAVSLGFIPILGISSLLCLFLGLALRLNQPTLQAINYFMSPVQLATIPLFLTWGNRAFGDPSQPVPLNPRVVVEEFFANTSGFLSKYGLIGLHATLLWMIVIPWVGLVVFLSSRALFRSWMVGAKP